MKCLYLTLLISAILPVGGFAESKVQDPAELYAQAVSNYVQGASKEVQAIKGQVTESIKQAPAAAKPRFVNVSKKLDECEHLVADLKTAGPSNFDTIKSAYERTRGELMKALATARQG